MRVVLGILVAAAMAALLPRLALAFFAYPSADDYCIVVETRQDGFWYMQVHSYLTWTGRYSAVFLESIVSQFDLAGIYPWVAVLTIIATIASVRMLLAALFENELSGVQITAMAAIIAAVFADGLPSGVEAFYWMPAAASYQWGLIVYLVWLSLLIRMARRDAAGGLRLWQRAVLVGLTLIIPGFNEVMAPLVLATMVAFVVANRWQRFASDRFMLMLLGLVVIFTAVAFVAPGNFVRSRVYPDLPSRHNLEFALVETARQTSRFTARVASNSTLWLAAAAAWWWVARVRRTEVARWQHPAYLAATLVGLIGIAYLTLFPVYWEYGAENYTGEGRTHNVTYVVLIAIALSVAGFVMRPVIDRLSGPLQRSRALRAGADVALATALAVLLISSPVTRSIYDALQAAPRYLEMERRRAAVLRESPKTDLVYVDRITVRPAGLFWGDVEPNPSHWINVCVANYYGLRGVRSRQ